MAKHSESFAGSAEWAVCDGIADQSALRVYRGEPPLLFDAGDDIEEFAAEIGRREALARIELLNQMTDRHSR